MSAGRLYDKLGDKAKGKVVFVIDGGVVCRIVDTGVEENLNIIDSDLQWCDVDRTNICVLSEKKKKKEQMELLVRYPKQIYK